MEVLARVCTCVNVFLAVAATRKGRATRFGVPLTIAGALVAIPLTAEASTDVRKSLNGRATASRCWLTQRSAHNIAPRSVSQFAGVGVCFSRQGVLAAIELPGFAATDLTAATQITRGHVFVPLSAGGVDPIPALFEL